MPDKNNKKKKKDSIAIDPIMDTLDPVNHGTASNYFSTDYSVAMKKDDDSATLDKPDPRKKDS